jgi:hypothetical protein
LQAGAAALGVFAHYISCDEDDMDVLQAAMQAEAELGFQHGTADANQAHHEYPNHQIASEGTLEGPAKFVEPDIAMLQKGHRTEEHSPSWQDDQYQGAPDIIFEDGHLEFLQAEEQLALAAQPQGSVRLAAPFALNVSSEAGEPGAEDWHRASPIRSNGPFAEGTSDAFVLCDDQEEGSYVNEPDGPMPQDSMRSSGSPQSLHRKGHASMEIGPELAPGGLQHDVSYEFAQRNGNNHTPCAEYSANVQNVDTGDSEFWMAIDEVLYHSRASSSRPDKAAALSEPPDVLILTDSQQLTMKPDVVVEQIEKVPCRQVQADWGAEDDGSQDIIFDDAIVDLPAHWMHNADANGPDDYLETPRDPEQQQIHGTLVATGIRRKRAREELRDKLIKVCAHQHITTRNTLCSNLHWRHLCRVLCRQKSLILWVLCRSFWRTVEEAASWSR